jgi:hypothetical protein
MQTQVERFARSIRVRARTTRRDGAFTQGRAMNPSALVPALTMIFRFAIDVEVYAIGRAITLSTKTCFPLALRQEKIYPPVEAQRE